jgi:hypothetical protein
VLNLLLPVGIEMADQYDWIEETLESFTPKAPKTERWSFPVAWHYCECGQSVSAICGFFGISLVSKEKKHVNLKHSVDLVIKSGDAQRMFGG